MPDAGSRFPVPGLTRPTLIALGFEFVNRFHDTANAVATAAPNGATPPPLWIRSILILTCTGVSFAHGSNDGQKGMGRIMLILIGVVPTAYALNRALPESATQPFITTSMYANRALDAQPSAPVQNVRNDMYLAGEAVGRLIQDPNAKLATADADVLKVYRSELNAATRYIPTWVKIAVAIALGARPEVKALARSYLSPENAAVVQRLGYVPLPTAALLLISRHLDANRSGTILGGRGSVVGLTPDVFADDERVKSALVR